MDIENSRSRATEYCSSRHSLPDFDNLLGTGQEGFVWRTDQDSAIKVYDRFANFERELRCYEILKRNGIFEIDGFTIPELLGYDADLLVLEMSIVAPPYILDFGKAYVGSKPEFPTEVMEDYDAEREDWFEGNWPLVQSALSSLEVYGIYYSDARPGNINCADHPRAVFDPDNIQ